MLKFSQIMDKSKFCQMSLLQQMRAARLTYSLVNDDSHRVGKIQTARKLFLKHLPHVAAVVIGIAQSAVKKIIQIIRKLLADRLIQAHSVVILVIFLLGNPLVRAYQKGERVARHKTREKKIDKQNKRQRDD